VRVALGVLLLMLVPSVVQAQTADAGTDLAAAQAEVDQDYAQAMASDCALACKALGSMKRATLRLCALDPGDRCAAAQQKLQAATAHVRASCPECAEELNEAPIGGKTTTPATADVQVLAAQESVQKRGGCAGCTMTSSARDGALPLGLAVLLGLLLRSRRRR
jgi:MYXO-CTERM domain-containing protein